MPHHVHSGVAPKHVDSQVVDEDAMTFVGGKLISIKHLTEILKIEEEEL